VEEVLTESKEKKTRDADGNESSYFVYSLFLVVHGKRHEINRSAGREFIEDLRSRLVRMQGRPSPF
jgi:hypothetical protein